MITNTKPISPGPASTQTPNYLRHSDDRVLLVFGTILFVGTVFIGLIGAFLC